MQEREPAAEIPSGAGLPASPILARWGGGARDLLVNILISAGEASGEMYGAQLIEALRRAVGHFRQPEHRGGISCETPGLSTARSLTRVEENAQVEMTMQRRCGIVG